MARVAPLPSGAVVRLDRRDDVPVVVRTLVERGMPVYGASARPPSLEDVYFAVEARIAAAEGRRRSRVHRGHAERRRREADRLTAAHRQPAQAVP